MKQMRQWTAMIFMVAGIFAFSGNLMAARGGGGGGARGGGGGFRGGGFHNGGEARRGGEGFRERGDGNWRDNHDGGKFQNWRNNHQPPPPPQNNVTVNPTVYEPGYEGDDYDGFAAASEAMAGMAMVTAVGAAAKAAASNPPTDNNTTIVVQAPPPQTVVVPVGAQTSALPNGCQNVAVNSAQYYECGQTWFKPFFGPTGVYYQAVQSPLPS